jgi:response regulator of citrate/malate metabolism
MDANRTRVLLVDDDLTFRPIYERLIREAADFVMIDWASNAEEAESLIEESISHNMLYDLILSDIYLSDSVTGLDLWKRFRLPETAFLITSGISLDKYESLMQTFNVNQRPIFLHKPLKVEECIKVIKTVLA